MLNIHLVNMTNEKYYEQRTMQLPRQYIRLSKVLCVLSMKGMMERVFG